MTDTLIKGQAADISPALWKRLQDAYPAKGVAYKEGDTLDSLAYRAGQQDVMEFIARHAKPAFSG